MLKFWKPGIQVDGPAYAVAFLDRVPFFARETLTAIDLERHLHGVRPHCARFCGGRARSRYRPPHGISRGRAADALLGPRAKSGRLINSERRKHRYVETPQVADQHEDGGIDQHEREMVVDLNPIRFSC